MIHLLYNRSIVPDAKDGRPFSDIPFQGVKALIKLFEKADLLTSEQKSEFENYKNTFG